MALRQAGSPSELRFRRRSLLLGVLLLPLSLAFYSFTAQQLRGPNWPLELRETPQRGRILSRDGTIFAEGTAASRQYPQGRLAAQVIGFSGAIQEDGRYGLEGLEYALDSQLQRGEDVLISLDPNLQAVVQTKLAETVTATQAVSASAVVLEAGTGRILAAASYPDYDPGTQASVQDRSRIANQAFMERFEPGSVMKPFVVAALLESGRLSTGEFIETPMHLRVGNQTFSDVTAHDEQLTAQDVLRYSSNSGMINLSERLSDLEQQLWLERFGFNADLALPGAFTRSGVVRDPPWYPQDKAAITIGQSMSTTTLQLAAAYSIFANDGLYVAPYLLEGQSVTPPERVISSATAATVRAMLRYTAERSSINLFPVNGTTLAGKTGTADIFDQASGRYVKGDYNLTFAGMVPAEQPKFVAVVTVHKPRTETLSTFVAVPLFSEIASEAVALWQLPAKQEARASQQ